MGGERGEDAGDGRRIHRSYLRNLLLLRQPRVRQRSVEHLLGNRSGGISCLSGRASDSLGSDNRGCGCWCRNYAAYDHVWRTRAVGLLQLMLLILLIVIPVALAILEALIGFGRN